MSIICNKGQLQHKIQLLQLSIILNVCKLNILNVPTFICKVNQKTDPSIFLSRHQKQSWDF